MPRQCFKISPLQPVLASTFCMLPFCPGAHPSQSWYIYLSSWISGWTVLALEECCLLLVLYWHLHWCWPTGSHPSRRTAPYIWAASLQRQHTLSLSFLLVLPEVCVCPPQHSSWVSHPTTPQMLQQPCSCVTGRGALISPACFPGCTHLCTNTGMGSFCIFYTFLRFLFYLLPCTLFFPPQCTPSSLDYRL